MDFDDKGIDLQTHWARKELRDQMRHLDDARLDPHSGIRRSEHECVVCFYLRPGILVGQGFTRFTCKCCGKETSYPNTGVPRLCPECADKLKICRRCGADLELRDRVPVDPGASPTRQLAALLQKSGARVTFDPERDITRPCFKCGAEKSEKLVDLEYVDHKEQSRIVTRPICADCIRAAAESHRPLEDDIPEREVDQRTIKRLLLQLSKAYHELEQKDPGRFRVGDVVSFAPQDKRARWWLIASVQPGADGDWFVFEPVTRKLTRDLTRNGFSGGQPQNAELVRRTVR